jgi:hypothetical protein
VVSDGQLHVQLDDVLVEGVDPDGAVQLAVLVQPVLEGVGAGAGVALGADDHPSAGQDASVQQEEARHFHQDQFEAHFRDGSLRPLSHLRLEMDLQRQTIGSG